MIHLWQDVLWNIHHYRKHTSFLVLHFLHSQNSGTFCSKWRTENNKYRITHSCTPTLLPGYFHRYWRRPDKDWSFDKSWSYVTALWCCSSWICRGQTLPGWAGQVIRLKHQGLTLCTLKCAACVCSELSVLTVWSPLTFWILWRHCCSFSLSGNMKSPTACMLPCRMICFLMHENMWKQKRKKRKISRGSMRSAFNLRPPPKDVKWPLASITQGSKLPISYTEWKSISRQGAAGSYLTQVDHVHHSSTVTLLTMLTCFLSDWITSRQL